MKRHAVALCTVLAICLSAWSGAAGAQPFPSPTLTISGKSKISVAPGHVAATQLAVTAMQNNAAFAGAHVRFSMPGICGTFAGASIADVVTDASGRAVSPAFTAGPTPNTCTATATITDPGAFANAASFTIYVYDPLNLRMFADPGAIALVPGQEASGSATLWDASQRPIIDAALHFTSPSAGCGTFPGAALTATFVTDSGGTAFYSGFKAGPAALGCSLSVQWPDGGASLTVPVEVFDVASATIATAPGATNGFVNEGTWIMMQLRSPNGTALPNVPLTFGVTAGRNGGSATLDRAGGTTDAHGLASVLATNNANIGDYSINVGFMGTSKPLAINTALRLGPKPAAPGGKYGDMWWGGVNQNGWGLSVIQHRDTLFAVMFLYNSIGEPWWIVFPGGSWDATHVYYSGPMYITYSTPYYNYDYHRLGQSGFGFMTLAFLTDDSGWVQLDSFGQKSLWNITRQKFGPLAPPMGDHTDMWWGGPTQNGWGVSVIQQNQSLFVVWFTYRADGGSVWFVAPSGTWVAPETWEGSVYRTATGTYDMLRSNVYDPSSLQVKPVGSIRLRFAGDNATLEYTIDGNSGSNALQRQGF